MIDSERARCVAIPSRKLLSRAYADLLTFNETSRMEKRKRERRKKKREIAYIERERNSISVADANDR